MNLDALEEAYVTRCHTWTWEMVKPTAKNKSWKKIFPENEEHIWWSFDEHTISAPELSTILNGGNVKSEIKELQFEVDWTILGHEIVNDDSRQLKQNENKNKEMTNSSNKSELLLSEPKDYSTGRKHYFATHWCYAHSESP